MHQKFSSLLIHQSPWRASCEDSDSLLKGRSYFSVNVCFLGSMLQRYASLQGVGVTLHHATSASGCFVSVSPRSVSSVSTLWWFAVGEGSRPSFNHHTPGGHHSLRRRLFRIPGGPESLKWSFLRSACWEEGGNSRWQRVGVGHLTNTGVYQVCVVPFGCADRDQISSVDCGGAAHRQNDADYRSHVLLQEEHHHATVVPLLRAPAGEHLHSGAEYPRRQPRQHEEGFGGRTSGLYSGKHQHNNIKEQWTSFINNTDCSLYFVAFPPQIWIVEHFLITFFSHL